MKEAKEYWFVGCVKSCQEKRVAEVLRAFGVDHYLAVKKVVRQWSDRRKVVDSLVIPRIIFVHCTEAKRLEVLKRIPALYCFMCGPEKGKVARVPQKEMDDFMAMVEGSTRPIGIESGEIAPGDMVRVITGPLAGNECEVVRMGSSHFYIVRLPMLGAATMSVADDTVEKI